MNDIISEILSQMIKSAVKAGQVIIDFYNGDVDVWSKSDMTPVTSADIAASDVILSTLKEKYPSSAFLCEETKDEADEYGVPLRLSAKDVFIIDPLDGTRAFIEKRDQFAVSISYVVGHDAKAAVIYAPALHMLYYAAKDCGAYKSCLPSEDHVPFSGERLYVSDRSEELRVLLGSTKDDPEAVKLIEANRDRIAEVIKLSSCIKGCLIAEGLAEAHYKFAGYTKEWDTSAEELIVREAGGVVTDAYGGELISNRPDVRNLSGIRLLNSIESALRLP